MNLNIYWPDKTLPVEIYCAPGVLTELEIIAADGLLAIPRTGLGMGGLLLGRWEQGRIEILQSVEICCSHALGPAFTLTPGELTASLELPLDHDVVGWYCSKPNYARTPTPMILSEQDRALFNALCPQRWQLALLIRPGMGQTTTAAFACRDSGNTFRVGAPLELAWQELAAFREPAAFEEPAPEPLASAPAVVTPPQVEPVRKTDPPEEPPAPLATAPPWPLYLGIAVVLLALPAIAAFYIRRAQPPSPPVALIGLSNGTGRLSLMWNGEVFSKPDPVTLLIDDSAGPHTIHLSQAAAHTGWYQYDCHPGTVTATLVAGDSSDTVTLKIQGETYLPDSGISK